MSKGLITDDGTGWKKIRRMRKELFGGICPYTSKSCSHFKCEECAVEDYEIKQLNEYLKEIGKDENND